MRIKSLLLLSLLPVVCFAKQTKKIEQRVQKESALKSTESSAAENVWGEKKVVIGESDKGKEIEPSEIKKEEIEPTEAVWGPQEMAVAQEKLAPLITPSKSTPKPLYSKTGPDEEELKMDIGAFTQLDASFADQDNPKGGKESRRPHLAVSNTNIKLSAEGKTKTGLTFGYTIRTAPQVKESTIVDRNFLYIEKAKVGRFEGGNLKAVQDPLCKDAQKLFGGSGGWDGGVTSVYNDTFGACSSLAAVGDPKTATKLSLLSAKYYGFQAAISYTPNVGHVGKVARNNDDTNAEEGMQQNVGGDGIWFDKKKSPVGHGNISTVLRFEKECERAKFGLAGCFIYDDPNFKYKNMQHKETTAELRKTQSYIISGLLGYKVGTPYLKEVNFGVEYINNGKSRLPKEALGNYAKDDADATGRPMTFKHIHKGNAGQSINAVVQFRVNDQNAFAFGYDFTWRRTGPVDNGTADGGPNGKVTRSKIGFTYDRKIREGLSAYFEIAAINGKASKEFIEEAEKGFKAIGSEKTVIGNNRGLLFIAGVHVAI